jgi:kynurenine formamidase
MPASTGTTGRAGSRLLGPDEFDALFDQVSTWRGAARGPSGTARDRLTPARCLHPTAARFLAERQVTAPGSDGNNDTAPSAVVDAPLRLAGGTGSPVNPIAVM